MKEKNDISSLLYPSYFSTLSQRLLFFLFSPFPFLKENSTFRISLDLIMIDPHFERGINMMVLVRKTIFGNFIELNGCDKTVT